MSTTFLKSAAIVLGSAWAALPAHAATAILDIPSSVFDSYENNAGASESHGNGMVGWVFSVQNPVTVTRIGWYDQGGDGLSRDFRVGLWHDTSGQFFSTGSTVTELLGSGAGTTVPAGTAAALDGFFRVIDLAVPITLQPGQYQIGGLDTVTTPDPIAYVFDGGMGAFNTPDVSVSTFFYAGQSAPPQPGTFGWLDSSHFYLATGVEMGPMLFVVPEVSSSVLAVAGLASGLTRRRVTRR